MKFISKNSNLHIILQPGQPANPVTQTPPVPALSVRFMNGQADISDEALVEKMMRHPAFNQDFIAVEEAAADPYAHLRAAAEPQHVTTELKYGHPVGRNVPPTISSLPPELKKMITDQATLIAAEMVKSQLPSIIAEALKTTSESKTDTAPVTPEPTTEEQADPAPEPTQAPKSKTKSAR